MLEIKNIYVAYDKKEVLSGVDLSFSKGTLTSIIGANGCGKTTLLKSALGILPVKRGAINVDGEDLLTMKRRDIAKKISYLSQGMTAPSMTVGEMVLHGRFPRLSYPRVYTDEDRRIAREAMGRFGISELCDTPISSLSGGMRQNVYLAMAIAQDTDYIFLDEPTTYLDLSNRLSLMRTLRSLSDGGCGIVNVTHDLTLAFDFSDFIAVMDKGKILAVGTPDRISKLGIIEQIFSSSLKKSDDGQKFYYDYK